MNINALYKRVKKFDSQKSIEAAFDSTLTDLVELNRDRMAEGVRSDGTVMPDYSVSSVVNFGKEPGPIKLLDTGDFQQNITVQREGLKLNTFSRDSKNDMLINDYGIEIFGTGGEYKKTYIRENLRPAFIGNVRKELKL